MAAAHDHEAELLPVHFLQHAEGVAPYTAPTGRSPRTVTRYPERVCGK